MKSSEDVLDKLVRYKDHLLCDGKFDTYDQGLVNGLEIALAMIEERPAFFVDINKKHSDNDIKSYPEYFL